MSDKYFQNWSKRNKISYRRITHEGQADLQTMIEKQMIMKSYFEELKRKTQSLSGDKIIQMDETPCYFDMARDHTSFKGFKNVDSSHTGGRKKRFTVCLAINLEGKMLKAMVIFHGLKKVPNMNKTHREVFVTVSKTDILEFF